MALEGEGVGRTGNPSGKVAFVPYTLPGEKIETELRQEKRSFDRCLPINVVQASVHRVAPRCLHHFQIGQKTLWCGGCDWQHIETSHQLEIKRTLIKETLEKLGGLKDPPVEPVVPSPVSWRYRNKVQVPFAKRGNRIVSGFYAPGSHTIVEFDDCVAQPERVVQLVKFVKEYAAKNHWSPYDQDRHAGWLRHILVRTNEAGQALVVLVTKAPPFPGKNVFTAALHNQFPWVFGIHQNVQPAQTNVILGNHWVRLWGNSYLEEEICGLSIEYAPASFFQVNTKAAEFLYQNAIKEVQCDSATLVLDLYCGVGCMTLLAAKETKHAVGVEMSASSIRDAKKNAQRNNLRNVDFLEMSAEQFFRSERFHWLKKNAGEVKVLVDPPRSGCEPHILYSLLSLGPKRIVYVSCNPATLARDVKILSKNYRLQKVIPVDLFPQTSHIESISSLERTT